MAPRRGAISWLHPQLFCCIFLVILAASPPQQSALALPIQIPDLSKCELATDTSIGKKTTTTIHPNCCLPVPKGKIIDFSLSEHASAMRVRRAADKVSAAYVKKYARAYALMKALPEDDPRSFHMQANVHCAFCNFAYKQRFNSSLPLQMHFSWLFLPWHRWYLYFHERILASLVGDPTFSLVYWNWADQEDGGNVMPAMFLEKGTSLYDASRNGAHLPPALVKLVASAPNNNSARIKANLNIMHTDVVSATTAELFMGGVYVTGTDLSNSTVLSAPLAGHMEAGVHNAIHYWTGDLVLPINQDMGTFSSAGRDPLFYAHHSQVDRLWEVWRHGLPSGPRADHSDPEFLNAEFIFYDERARPIRVLVRDALDNAKLGISYAAAPTDALWINYNAIATTSGSAVPDALALGVSLVGAHPMNATIPLGSRLAAIVKAPTTSSTSTEVLVVQSLRAKRDKFTSLQAFVNLPAADSTTDASSAEFLGAFNIIPIAATKHLDLMTNVKFAIGKNLQRLGLQKEPEVVVTLIVSGNLQPMTIEGLLIEYE